MRVSWSLPSTDKRATSTLSLCCNVDLPFGGWGSVNFLIMALTEEQKKVFIFPGVGDYGKWDEKRRFFISGETVRLTNSTEVLKSKDCNPEFVFEVLEKVPGQNFSVVGALIYMRYSQICRVSWNCCGDLCVPKLIAPDGERDIIDLSAQAFAAIGEGRKLRTTSFGGDLTTETKEFGNIFVNGGTFNGGQHALERIRREYVEPFLVNNDKQRLTKTALYTIDIVD